jgi:hypothetical protein
VHRDVRDRAGHILDADLDSTIARVAALTVWVPDIRATSCDLRVLMDQPTEAISSHDPPRRRHDNWHAGLKWRWLRQGAVRAVAVVLAWARRNCRHVSADRIGAGSTPARCRMAQTVLAPIR